MVTAASNESLHSSGFCGMDRAGQSSFGWAGLAGQRWVGVASSNVQQMFLEGRGGGRGRDNAWRSRAPGPHAHRNAVRQVMDGLRTELCGQEKQSNDPRNSQYNLNTPTIGRR